MWRKLAALMMSLAAVSLVACGGGGEDDDDIGTLVMLGQNQAQTAALLVGATK